MKDKKIKQLSLIFNQIVYAIRKHDHFKQSNLKNIKHKKNMSQDNQIEIVINCAKYMKILQNTADNN